MTFKIKDILCHNSKQQIVGSVIKVSSDYLHNIEKLEMFVFNNSVPIALAQLV